MQNKQIAIWAPLRYCNYGDDMQAIALAKYIISLGYKVKLFQLDEDLAKQYKLRSAATLDGLFQDVRICVIAGGALLTPQLLHKRMLMKAAAEYEQDFGNINKSLKRNDVLFCAISIGGDGRLRNPFWHYSKNRINFFKSPSLLNGTVRLEGDIQQMKKFGKEFCYYPDMLFRAPEFFKYGKLPKSKKYRVGINFKKGKYLDRALIDMIHLYAQNNDDIEFHFMTTHMEKVGLNYQYLPPKESKNIFISRYKNPNQLLSRLASMDVFITSMLHLGLTGLTVGTPFVSYRGPGKTKTFLHSIKGDWAILNDNITFNELKKNVFSKTKEELFNNYDTKILENMADESYNHFLHCKKIIEEYA
jgi:hypothetical protein